MGLKLQRESESVHNMIILNQLKHPKHENTENVLETSQYFKLKMNVCEVYGKLTVTL